MTKEQKIAYFHSILFMFISPAYTLYHGLRSSFSYDAKRWLFIVFITIYGSVITLSVENDGYRHRENVYDHYINLPFSQFIQEAGRILTFQNNPETNQDIYIHVLSFFVGSVLHLPSLFFVFVSFVYAYFFAGSLFRLLRFHRRKNYHWLFYGFLIIFILLKNIEGISTVRTWTGLWILFYGSLSYYQTKKKKYLFLMFAPPLVHVGYFLMALPTWIVLIFGVRPKIFALIFALSFFINLPNPDRLFGQLEETEVGAAKVKAYSVEKQSSTGGIQGAETAKTKVDQTWYRTTQKYGLQVIASNILAFALILFLIYPSKMETVESHLFSIGILTMAFSNLTWILYAVSSRSGLIAMVFIVSAFVLMWRRNYFEYAYLWKKKLLLGILKISFLMFIPFIIYQTANIIYTVSVYMLAFPFIPWFTDDLNYSIREFLGIFI